MFSVSLPFEVQIPRWFFWVQNKWTFFFLFKETILYDRNGYEQPNHESRVNGSDNFIPFQRMDELFNFYQATWLAASLFNLDILWFYLNVPNGTIRCEKQFLLIYSKVLK